MNDLISFLSIQTDDRLYWFGEKTGDLADHQHVDQVAVLLCGEEHRVLAAVESHRRRQKQQSVLSWPI
jgi:hypothetical protein